MDTFNEFIADKRNFFEQAPSSLIAIENEIDNNTSYATMASKQFFLEREFATLFAVLQDQETTIPNTDKNISLLYGYHCCYLLTRYYAAYDKPSKVAEYQQYRDALKKQYERGLTLPGKKLTHPPQLLKKNTIHWPAIKRKIHDDIEALRCIPQHSSKLKDLLGVLNITRIHMVFCRLTDKQCLIFAQKSGWIDKLNHFMGTTLSVDKMLARLDLPVTAFNLLSVALFAARFLLNVLTVLKHTITPPLGMKDDRSTTALERFKAEIKERHLILLNDLVWGTVNLLSNFAPYFHVATSFANGLTGAFLVFDIGLMIHRRELETTHYLLQKRAYEQGNTAIDRLQLTELTIKQQANDAYYFTNIAAAGLLMVSFSASMIMTLPFTGPLCFMAITVGVSMYLVADLVKEAVLQKSLYDNKVEKGLVCDKKIYNDARTAVFVSLAKNVISPLLFFGIFAISVPTALAMMACCLGLPYLHSIVTTPDVAENVSTGCSYP